MTRGGPPPPRWYNAADVKRPLYLVDAFTDRPFGGNPAGVVLLDAGDEPDAAYLHRVAAEVNHSETAFVTLPPEGGAGGAGPFGLRWFTPTREVDLCGHATLAAAHALYDAGKVSLHEPVEFRTRSGPLRAAPDADWRGFWLDFPATPPREASPPAGLVESLGLAAPPRFVGLSTPADGVDDGSDNDYFDWFVEVDDADAVRAASPDFRRLRDVTDGLARGAIVAAAGGEADDADAVSRCFYPAYGIDEDPVTGSAHCTIGPYFARTLRRDDLRCRQVSRRGGELRLRVEPDRPRVHIGGRAVTVFRGQLVV